MTVYARFIGMQICDKYILHIAESQVKVTDDVKSQLGQNIEY